jgi:hypothetical protein
MDKEMGGEEVKIGDTVYRFGITLDFLKNAVTTTESEFIVLGINEQRLVINDISFTRLQYKNETYAIDTPFKIAKISRWNTKPYWDEIRGYIYTDNKSKTIARKAIKKALKEYLYENYGRYCKGIDLLEKLEEV